MFYQTFNDSLLTNAVSAVIAGIAHWALSLRSRRTFLTRTTPGHSNAPTALGLGHQSPGIILAAPIVNF